MHITLNDMPTLKPIPDWTKSNWVVVNNWHYTLPNGIHIIIPSGFVTDLVSIPRPLWSIISPFGSLLLAGLIHDFGYKYNYLWAKDRNGTIYKYAVRENKDFWDGLFLEIANQTNHSPAFNTFVKGFLTLFGSTSWNEHRKEQPQDLLVRL